MGGKGGSKIEVNNYQMSLHLGLCYGPVDAITGAYYGEKRYWAGYNTDNSTQPITQPSLFGGEKKEGGIHGNLTFLMGKSDQVLPDWFAQKLGRANGLSAPGFRNITTVVHSGPAPGGKAGWMWCSNSPYLKSMWYEVVSIPRTLSEQYSRINIKREIVSDANITLWKYKVIGQDDPTDYSAQTVDDSTWEVGRSPFGDNTCRYLPSSGVPAPSLYGFKDDPETTVPSDKKVWLRTFIFLQSLPVEGLTIEVFVDNYSDVWINGLLVAKIGSAAGGDFYEVGVPASALKAGSNYVAIMTVGKKGSGCHYFDWRLSIGSAKTSVDANPAHIIYSVLTNPDYGMGLDPATAIDVPAFIAAAKTLYGEGLGLSLKWSTTTAAEDFINEIKDHINAVIFPDPETGKIVLKLIRDDYDKSSLRNVNPDNSKITNFGRKAWGDTINEVVVTWTNPKNEQEETVTLQDLGNIAEQGEIVSDGKNYYGVRSADLAWQLAARDLRVASAPLCLIEVELDRSFWNLKPGDCLTVTWPEYGITNLVMRVWEVKYGRRNSNKITASLTEDVFSLPVSAFVKPPSSEWVDMSQLPVSPTATRIITMPAFGVASFSGSGLDNFPYPTAYAGVLANDPNGDTNNFSLLAETHDITGNTVWEQRGTMPVSGYGKLSNALPFEAVSVATGLVSLYGVQPAQAVFMLIGSGDDTQTELAIIQSESAGTFTIKRGLFDTIPRQWAAGTPVWYFTQDFMFADATPQSDGSQPKYKILTNTSLGQLPQAGAPVLTGTLNDRLQAPYRPADVKVGGVAFGQAVTPSSGKVPITWARRNRLTEETVVLAWTDSDTAPEPSQTTKIVLTNPTTGAVVHTVSGLTGTSYELDTSSVAGIPDEVLVTVGSELGGLDSLQNHSIALLVSGGGYGLDYGSHYG